MYFLRDSYVSPYVFPMYFPYISYSCKCIPCEPPTETVIASTPAAELLAPDPPPPKQICSPPLPEGPPTCLQLAG